jgi:hypothetical protein
MNMLSLNLIFLSEAIDHYELILNKNNKNLFSIYFQFILFIKTINQESNSIMNSNKKIFLFS